ncbi:hypothetical protein [Mariniblastus fucicola]|uniref:Metal-dependent hydrolase n=1 Tax=Mariniblastus fucicola TaxID=980251 RepID=A0A5B9PHE5_9BACT|nr:hypothetical protein [Mariniblastus fucicola]QEG24710.1 hypothetical protein MFFC18_46320 [Mariniblastus fucicola]
MMTQTHVLLGLAAFGRPREPLRNGLAIAGGIIPDAAIFLLYVIEKLKGTPERIIWRDVYFSPFWQDAVAWGNSIPLWLLLLAIGALLWKRSSHKTAGAMTVVFAASCLLHMACDFPLHVDDAHRHLFPVSDWRFRSPVSYWDPKHFGGFAAFCETLLGIGLSVWMWMRYPNLIARIGLGVLLVGYLAVPAWFALQFLKSQ